VFLSNHPIKVKIHLAILIPYALFMLVWGLGDRALQVDEGSDTFVSATILEAGLPRHSDGVNNVMDYADIRDGLFVYRTWAPYYLQALSLAVLGKTTVAARLPFALCGLAGVVALYLLALRITKDPETALLAAVFTASSITALLYFRTARYIALPILLTPLLLGSYLKLFENRRGSIIPFLTLGFLFFQTMYVNFAALLAAFAIHLWIYRDRLPAQNAKKIIPAAGVIALFSIPWLIYIHPVFAKISRFYLEGGEGVDDTVFGYPKRLLAYLFQTNDYIFPLILTPFLLRKKTDAETFHSRLLLLCVGALMVGGTLHKVPLYQYIACVIPLLHILLAGIIVNLCKNRNPLWLPAATVVLIATNIIHVGPLIPVQWAFEKQIISLGDSDYIKRAQVTFSREVALTSKYFDYLYEISHPQPGPLDVAVVFFKAHGKAGETCYIDNETDSFAFFTGAKMIRLRELTPDSAPQWIILRGDYAPVADPSAKLTENGLKIKNLLDSRPYEKFVLNSLPRHNNNSYEIQLHQFRPQQATGTVTAYRLAESNQPSTPQNNPS
jgi:hypothetical protein